MRVLLCAVMLGVLGLGLAGCNSSPSNGQSLIKSPAEIEKALAAQKAEKARQGETDDGATDGMQGAGYQREEPAVPIAPLSQEAQAALARMNGGMHGVATGQEANNANPEEGEQADKAAAKPATSLEKTTNAFKK